MVFWSDDKELSSEANAIGWNSLSQKKKKKKGGYKKLKLEEGGRLNKMLINNLPKL